MRDSDIVDDLLPESSRLNERLMLTVAVPDLENESLALYVIRLSDQRASADERVIVGRVMDIVLVDVTSSVGESLTEEVTVGVFVSDNSLENDFDSLCSNVRDDVRVGSFVGDILTELVSCAVNEITDRVNSTVGDSEYENVNDVDRDLLCSCVGDMENVSVPE